MSGKTIVMEESVWRNSSLSLAARFGGIKIDGTEYVLLDERGRDLWECTEEADRLGREYAIEPGMPCDLVRKDFARLYRKLGRRKFLAIMRANDDVDDTEMKEIMKHTQMDYKPTVNTQQVMW